MSTSGANNGGSRIKSGMTNGRSNRTVTRVGVWALPVTRPWNPGEDIARTRDVREPHVRSRWPAGATVGLAMVAAACLTAAIVLYRVAGPPDVFGP